MSLFLGIRNIFISSSKLLNRSTLLGPLWCICNDVTTIHYFIKVVHNGLSLLKRKVSILALKLVIILYAAQ